MRFIPAILIGASVKCSVREQQDELEIPEPEIGRLEDWKTVDHEDVNYAEVYKKNKEKKGDMESISLATPTALDSIETHQRRPMCLA